MSGIETLIALVVILAYSIGRQLAGEALRVKRLIGLPVALVVIGVVDIVTSKGPGATRLDIFLIGAGCAINAIIGICQGHQMRLGCRDGYLWGKMPPSVLWWWALKIASGIVIDGIAHALGAHLATISAVMLFELGVNRLAQGAIVATRGFSTGVPFAPEPHGPSAEPSRSVTSPKSPTFDDEFRSTTRSLGSAASPTHLLNPTTSLVRQLSQMLLREMDHRINSTPK